MSDIKSQKVFLIDVEKGQKGFGMIFHNHGQNLVERGIRIIGEKRSLAANVKGISEINTEGIVTKSNFDLGGSNDFCFQVLLEGFH